MHQSNSAFNNLLQFLSVKMKKDFLFTLFNTISHFQPDFNKKGCFCNNLKIPKLGIDR